VIGATAIFPRVFSPVDVVKRAAWLLAAAAGLVAPVGAGELLFTFDRIEAHGLVAKAVRAHLAEGAPGRLELSVGELSFSGRSWHDLRVTCARFRVALDRVECQEGEADFNGRLPFAFVYSAPDNRIELVLRPEPAESWRLTVQLTAHTPEIVVEVENGDVTRITPWLPEALPRPARGRIAGEARLSGPGFGRLEAGYSLQDLAFSDADGLRAGEQIAGQLQLKAAREGTAWRVHADMEWTAGELFWQPVYLRAAGQSVTVEGVVDGREIAVERAGVQLPGIGEFHASGSWDRDASALIRAEVRTGPLDAAALYPEIVKPFLFGTVLGELRANGVIELAGVWREDRIESIDVAIRDLSVEDANRRFAVFGVNGRLPWHRTELTTPDLAIDGGELLRIPFGPARLPLSMRGLRFRLDTMELPLLDGMLTVKAFATEPPEDGWRWALQGGIQAVSMERFTEALGLPRMHGLISAEIPQVRYARSTLEIGGALMFEVFDGTVSAQNVTLVEPFGLVPRLNADIAMRHLDLDLLTRTFSFGRISGRVDADITNLELANWQPVRFDARMRSSPGDYPRQISQAAVQNITALGGAGAASAIQGTFLRFFEQFRYEELGFSCRLEQGVCSMGGLEDAGRGYVIVRGGGIPALSVLGYNRSVDWKDLVERLRRIVQENIEVIVR
jgi:hypothetical protein